MDETPARTTTADADASFLLPLLESAVDILVVLDPEGRILETSPTAETHLGYARDELRGRDAFSIVHEEDAPGARRILAHSLAHPGAAEALRFRVRHRDGRWRVLDGRGRTIATSGAALRMVVSAYDVTDQVEAEARAVRLQAALFRISETAATASGLDELYPALHAIVGELMDARHFFVALRDADGVHLRFPYFVDEAEAKIPERLPVAGTLSGHVMSTRAPHLVRPEDFERLKSSGAVKQVGAPSVDWLGVPLMRGEEAFGVLVVQTYDEGVRYSEADRDVLTFVSRHVATAIDRQQARESLEDSARRFRLLFQGNPLAMWVYDPATLAVLDVNEAALRQYGYPRDEFLALTVDALSLPEEAETVRRRIRSVVPGAPTPPVVLRHRRRDGTVFPVEISAQDLPLGPQHARVVVGRDLTEREKAEEALRRSEEQFRALIENAADLITVVGRDGRVRYQSPSVERVGGYRPQDVVGKDPGELLHPDDREAARRFFDEALARPGLTATVRVRFRHRDGSWRTLEGQGQSRLDLPGVDGVVFNLRDVTDRERAEAALRQRQKLESLGVLAGGVAHDFNNLLGAALGQSSLALKRMPADAPGRANVEKAIPILDRAAEIAAKMLAYSGQGHFAVRPLGLAALIEENRPHYEAALPPRVRLVLEAAPGLPPVMADAAQVHQLLLSLVINAGEAIGDRPGTVTIRGGSRHLRGERAEEFLWRHTGRPLAPGPYVSLEVQDDGAGMEAGTVSRIFDPFFTTKFVGRGLGLAAVLGTVRGHAGGIGVESAPGRGTCVTVLLPEARPPEGRADEGPATILVADQEEALREVVRDVLEASGFLVVARADARAAAELFEEDPRRYALVLLGLPARGSTETLERFRRADASVPVLLTSGFARPAEADHDGRRLGFLPQPFTASELLAAVRSHLPTRRPA